MAKQKPHLNLIFIGHIDHGKSTLIGRLFVETGVVSKQQLEKFRAEAAEYGKGTWEYAYAVDLSKEERKKGITIELAHKKFDTDKYEFTVIDAPGHKDFVKNMITGASQADAAVLVVSTKDGIQDQTREHAYLARVLGIGQLIVALNKVDTINYDQAKYDAVKKEVTELLKSVGYDMSKVQMIPTSAIGGDNIIAKGDKLTWYSGPTLKEAFDNFVIPEAPVELPLRLPIQDVYSIKGIGTVPVGKVETGVFKKGQKIVFMPSGAQGEVKSIEMHHEEIEKAEPGDNVGFNVRGVAKEDIRRGDVVGTPDQPPTVAKRFEARIFVLRHPTVLTPGYTPVFHCHTAQVACKFVKLKQKLDPRTGAVKEENPEFLRNGDAAIVELEPTKPMVIEERGVIPQMASFAIRDMGQTVAAGICTKILEKR
ncbi:translation elongation factor EF-1 subunit alpha [archaeon CG10_big_fil_rev_8_21_14_0_10_43_11]|nr:MAG: translation elongation factor EF-1 subunit alpha [archaeon CG10_big_fil_rev_8_21_14_0_10_43_11]